MTLCLAAILLVLILSPVVTDAQSSEAKKSFEKCKNNDPAKCYYPHDGDKYGFNVGLGRGGKHDAALEWGARYSVDRCALGHDRHFWSNGYTEATAEEDYSNNLGFYRCVASVRPDIIAQGLGWGVEERFVQDGTMGRWEDLLKGPKDAKRDYPYAALPMDLSKVWPQYAKRFKPAIELQECHVKYPSYVHPKTKKKYEPAFYDPRKGGECWACPKGYATTIWGLMAPNKCERGGVLGVGSSHAYAKYVGKADKKDWNVNGRYYGCPKGYRRTYDRDFEAGLNNWKLGLTPRDRLTPDKDPNACMPTASPDDI